jgi:ABC-type phosphate transport system substrate-binding protein
MRKTLRGGVAFAAAAFVVSGLMAAPAQADPKFTPDADDIVGVGSDTTQFVVGALAHRFNVDHIGGTKRMASWDATGTATIVPRSGAPSITRPNGSSAGIDELQVDSNVSFARSSRGPNPTGDEGTVFFPFAKDTLGYVYAKPTTNVNLNLGPVQLKSIYTCQKTNWNQFKGGKHGHIHARVPQPGSGTRTFFEASIGITETQLQDAIAQPNKVCDVEEVQEHDPTAVIGDANAIAPFSLARYTILSKAVKTTIGYAHKSRFNVTRNVYNVVRTSDVAALGQFFDDTSWICTNADAKAIIAAQGFHRLPAGQCGVAVVA